MPQTVRREAYSGYPGNVYLANCTGLAVLTFTVTMEILKVTAYRR